MSELTDSSLGPADPGKADGAVAPGDPSQWPEKRGPRAAAATVPGAEKCILVGLNLRDERPRRGAAEVFGFSAEESMAELIELVEGAGAQVIGTVIQTRPTIDPATLIGHGKVLEVKAWAEMEKADCVLFDQSISPTQQRNLEREIPCRVIDRTQLILDIFAKHARTREGQLQVELAQLTYLLPRLTGKGAELSRLGGGIGTRGPGETKLETDRRRIDTRIQKLKRDLEVVRKTRELQRKKRSAVPLATVALAGYTNAGKSTLFNALTQASVLADARMFATLDPTIRVLGLPSRRGALLSDTVGFIRNLPPDLIQSFRATLEEVTRAAVIVHVIDLASPHRREQMIEVEKVLDELDAAEKPHILAMNKIDLVERAEAVAVIEAERSAKPTVEVVGISAKSGQGMAELLAAIDRLLPGDPLVTARYLFSHGQGDRLSYLYEHGRVLERRDTGNGVEVLAEAAQSIRDRLEENVIAPPSGMAPTPAESRKQS